MHDRAEAIMRAMQVHALGGPDFLRVSEVPDLTPGPGEVRVDVEAAGVNFPDGLMVAGTYQTKPELPFSPGSEVAGTVGAVGTGVTAVAPGDRVVAFCGIGGYAEQVVVPAERAHRIPDEMPAVHAAALPVAYGTSYHGLVDRAGLAAGATLLVLGASGGVGLTAVQIGAALGARVLAAASTPEKRALAAENGAAEVLDYTDLKAKVGELTGGAGADVVYDPVGGTVAEDAVRTLGWAGAS